MPDELNIPFHDLVDHVLGEATPEVEALVAARATDPAVSVSLASIRSLIDALRGADEQPPPDVRERACRLFDLRTGALPAGFEAIDVVVARLVEDTREPEAAAGFRGEAVAYQLCFDAEFAEVHLHITADSGEPCHVRGQVDVFEPQGPGLAVSFRRTGREEMHGAAVDATGQFKLELPPATYDLIVTVGARTLLVPAVEIG